MKRFLVLFLLLQLMLPACSAAQTPEHPTATSLPTETPAPTLTPLPTDTSTPVPTSTPDKTATAAAQSTAAADAILQELDKLLGDTDIPYQQGHLEWKQIKPLKVSLHGPGWDYVEIDRDLAGKNFILKSDVTWEASGIILCTAIFRSEPNIEKGKQYQFTSLRLSGLPAWEIGVYEYGHYQNSPTKTHFSDAIDLANGATNEIILVVQEDHFDIYINKVHQGRYFDYSKQLTEGSFAFKAGQDSGDGTCDFENSWVWALEE